MDAVAKSSTSFSFCGKTSSFRFFRIIFSSDLSMFLEVCRFDIFSSNCTLMVLSGI